jgi:FAD-linked sulfhydryl oxidase
VLSKAKRTRKERRDSLHFEMTPPASNEAPSLKVKRSRFQKTPPAFGQDCDRPACDDMVSMMQQAKERLTTDGTSGSSKPIECPPSSASLGNSSWTLLHTMAAWYPDKPTTEDRSYITGFMNALARFYPCPWCAKDFRHNIEEKPVQTSSREALCTWLCEQHNIVNQKLGKPQYACDIKTLDERWRKSSKDACQSGSH